MKDTLIYLVTKIVDNAEKVSVREDQEDDRLVLHLTVDQSDMGKIIGKQGRTIRAIRDVIKLMAAKQNTYVDVIIDELPNETV